MNEAGSKLDFHEFYITPEGSEAALGELVEKTRNDPDLLFLASLKETFPQSQVYLVGGIVRDSLMGRESKDYDFIITGVALSELEDYLRQNGRIVAESDLQTAVFKFIPEGSKTNLDIAVPRIERYTGPSRKPDVGTENVLLEDDLSRRDLTMNAMAVRIDDYSGELMDPYLGVEDINNHLIRSVGDATERFSEDPLRMLRVLRFACRFGYEIAPETWQAVIKCKDQLSEEYQNDDGKTSRRVSMERVQNEINGSLKYDPEKFLDLYDQSGLLEIYLPEVSAMHNLPQPPNYHSEGDAYVHTRMVLGKLPKGASLELKMAALLHDIGKVDTFQSAEETGDRIRFNDHDEASKRKASEILTRLRYRNDFTKKTVWMIAQHMRMIYFPGMSMNTRKKMVLGGNKTMVGEDWFDDLVQLTIADLSSSIKENGLPDEGEISRLLEAVKETKEAIAADKSKTENQTGKIKVIDGAVVRQLLFEIFPKKAAVENMGLIRKVIEEIEELYHEGKLNIGQEAIDKAKEILLRKKLELIAK